MVPIGPRVGPAEVVGPSAVWLLVAALVASESAVAIAPPALPIKRPLESTHALAAMRRFDEMAISSPQPAAPSVGNSKRFFHEMTRSHPDSAAKMPG